MTQEEGYALSIFLNENEATSCLCTICQCVFKDATSIGCNEEHVFCRKCLECYFQKQINTQCPSCRQYGLNKTKMRGSKFADRIVKNLKVKCELAYQENAFRYCDWTGDLSALSAHITNQCPLYAMVCQYCNIKKKRYQMQVHNRKCSEKPLECSLKCNTMVKRRLMKTHIENDCPLQKLTCDECKENDILRKDMNVHRNKICRERLCQCTFVKYGCNERLRFKHLDGHLVEKEKDHLKLQIAHMETRMLNLEEENVSFKQEMLQLKEQKLLLLLQSKKAYVYDLKSNTTNRCCNGDGFVHMHDRFCIGKNIGYNDARKIGCGATYVDIIGNDIVFGVSSDKISAWTVKRNYYKIVSGKVSFQHYNAVWSQNHGLMLIGGRYINDKSIANREICGVTFNNDSFNLEQIATLSYSVINPSVYVLDCDGNETLFVCGGWWNEYNVSSCYIYNIVTKQWTHLRNMNHTHQCGGICLWKERGNKMIVAAGSVNNKVEEYDFDKNIWIDLPHLNKKHDAYPALMPSNNLLFCIGGVYRNDNNLGDIELYDARDNANKWIHVDSVQNYFNIPQDSGAGYNCFLPL